MLYSYGYRYRYNKKNNCVYRASSLNKYVKELQKKQTELEKRDLLAEDAVSGSGGCPVCVAGWHVRRERVAHWENAEETLKAYDDLVSGSSEVQNGIPTVVLEDLHIAYGQEGAKVRLRGFFGKPWRLTTCRRRRTVATSSACKPAAWSKPWST